MTAPGSGNSRVTTWMFSIFAVVTLYLLSAPPILILLTPAPVPAPVPPGYFGSVPFIRPPHWTDWYRQPYEWLHFRTPLYRPIHVNHLWWYHMLE